MVKNKYGLLLKEVMLKKLGMVGDGRKMFDFYKDKYGPFIIRKRKSMGENKHTY